MTTARFHLDKRNGKLMGVCAGFSAYSGIDPMLVRLAVVLATICGVGSMVLLYILVGLVASDRPY